MTDRLKGLVVTFDRDIREDDAEAIITAIRLIRGVAHAQPVIGNIDDQMNRTRIRHELIGKLYKALEE